MGPVGRHSVTVSMGRILAQPPPSHPGHFRRRQPQLRHIVAYWILALSMIAGIAWTFHSAQRREARAIAYVWHLLAAILSIAAIATLIVPEVEFQDEPLPVENNVNYDPCYSGGDPCG